MIENKKYIKVTLGEIAYCFHPDVWENYFHQIISINNNGEVYLNKFGMFKVDMPLKEAINSIETYNKVIIEKLFENKDFPKDEFLKLLPKKPVYYIPKMDFFNRFLNLFKN